MTIAPLHDQIAAMLCEMDKASNANECLDIYRNYLNLYRNEYPRANHKLTYIWQLYISDHKERLAV